MVPLILVALSALTLDSTCAPARGVDGKRVLETAIRNTRLTSSDKRLLRATGYDLGDLGFESDRWYPPGLLDATSFDEVFDPQSAVEQLSGRTSIAGFQFSAGRSLSDEAHAFDVRDTVLRSSPATHAAVWGTRPLNVWAVLDDWAASPTVSATERCVYREYPRLVLTRQGLRGTERLFIDEKSGYPTKLERVEPHYLWGQVRVEFLYSTWRLIDGVHVPGESYRIVDGIPEVTRVFADVHLAPADSAHLRLPAGNASGFALPAFLVPARPDTIRVGESVFLLKNAGYNEAVAMLRDTVFLFDATQGDQRAAYDSEWIGRLFPGKHAVVVVVTNLAWPHIAGVRYWVAHGATIVSHKAARSFLTRVVAQRWTANPDELERNRAGHRLRFKAVSDSLSMAGGRILLFAIDGAASEVALAGFLRDNRFLWASDFIQDLDGPSQYLDEMAAAVRRVGLTPDMFAAQHMPLSPWSRAAPLVSLPHS